MGHHQFSCTHALHYWIKALPWVTIKWLLNTIVDVLTGAFVESGLVLQKDQEHSLKLHATLMNTTQRRNRGGRQTFRGRIPFDAREIVASFGAHDWGQHQISEVQLSQRFVYDENGYYHCCGSIPIPSLSPV